jgi:hypothetical protein
MMDEEMRTETEQTRTRRDVVRLGAALLATGIGLASLTGAAAREREPGDDRGSGGGLDDPAGDDRGGLNGGGVDDNHRHRRRRRGRR